MDYDFAYRKIKSAYSSDLKEIKTVSKLTDEIKKEAFNALILRVDDAEETIAVNAAFSLSRLYLEDSVLRNKRIALSRSATPAVRFEILRQIQFRQGQPDSDDIEIIKNLCVYDLNLRGITDSLDSIIYFLVSKGHAEIVKNILATWVTLPA